MVQSALKDDVVFGRPRSAKEPSSLAICAVELRKLTARSSLSSPPSFVQITENR
jgi:hypothetical protein